ncbi:hypothetical protein GGI23_000532 [Coemansia sp. RSA 2559]|nr:hypothetical protein GGI23_000532 [Coemansia sp. RSA 2559]
MNVQNNNNNPNEIGPSETSSSSPSKESSSVGGTNNSHGKEFNGSLTYYNVGENEGACGGMHTNEEMVAALNSAQFQANSDGSSVYCGVCATILGDKAQITVKIVDECPSCNNGDLDLSPAAFAATTSADGEAYNIKWYFTQC